MKYWLDPPRIGLNFVPGPLSTQLDSDISLPCPITAEPKAKVTWFKLLNDGSRVPVKYNNRYTLQSDNSLQINSVSMEDVGTYICEAVNQYGRFEIENTFNLTGISPPTIASGDYKLTVLKGALERRITCVVNDAKPPAKVVWMKDGKTINLDSSKYSLSDTNLIIRDIKVDDLIY
ncbi:hypothetical protein Ciccas_002672 [Cichlidogyrus casuarinus]|uniref:Ig-like domain-containing protein n=1 Tax=Cichlidogyrus casuarinus TaxID=1844966 RepID=A0ABD2QGK2_9PLAT